MNKYKYCWVLQGYYGCGWEDLCCYDKDKYSYSEVKKDLRSYQENEGGSYRVVNRRVPNKE